MNSFKLLLGIAILVVARVQSFVIHRGNHAIGSPHRRRTHDTVASTFPFQRQPEKSSSFVLNMSTNDEGDAKSSTKLPMLLDPGTKGGALFLSLVLFIIPLVIYQIATSVFGLDEIDTGKWIGVGFTFFSTVLWVSTYIFRVATKDMTYAKQLKDYENAVIAKRLEELDDDEVQALVEDIERDEF